MFIGHFALGFAAKKAAPRTNLALLMVAPLFLDVLFPGLVLAGIEKMHVEPGNTAVFPIALDAVDWSHSLAMAALWSVLYGAFVWAVTKDERSSWLCAALVLSHWALDVVAHRPDMPLWPGSDVKLGFGLWYSVPATLAVELFMWGGALLLYFRATTPTARKGTVGPIVFAAFVTLSYFGSIFGPPPRSVEEFNVVAMASGLLIPFVWWFDKHRAPKEASGA